MKKTIGWLLLITTAFALWYSWPATIFMGIIDFIAFIVVVNTSPVIPIQENETISEPLTDDNWITDPSYSSMPGNIFHK